MWHVGVHVLLGDGRREQGLHRHAASRHGRSAMKTIGCVAGALALPFVLGAQSSYVVRAENTLALTRTDETISLVWTDVKAKLSAASPTQVRVRDLASGREVVSQVVDNDGNGTMDELIFQSTFAPS